MGRLIPAYSLTRDGKRVPDELIKEWICELITGDGFPYGYKKLTVCLQEHYGLVINHEKVYRLCKTSYKKSRPKVVVKPGRDVTAERVHKPRLSLSEE